MKLKQIKIVTKKGLKSKCKVKTISNPVKWKYKIHIYLNSRIFLLPKCELLSYVSKGFHQFRTICAIQFQFHTFKFCLPGCDWYSSKVEVVSDGVLEVVIDTSLWKSGIQVLT